MTRIVRMLIVATVGLAVSSASAQFIATFEAPDYNGSSSGTVLTGQRGWYLPAGNDPHVYTYASNALGLTATNPTGGEQFGGGIHTGDYARAQHDYDFPSNGVIRIAYDFNCSFFGTNTPPTSGWVGSISLQPSGTSQSIMAMREWTANVPPAYRITYGVYTNPASPLTSSFTGPIFDNLPTNHWFREEIVLDFDSHRITEVALTDLETSIRTVVTAPTNWYFRGGANSTEPLPTALRFFTGAPANNVLAYDNFTIGADAVGNADGASDIQTTSATLNGYLQSTGTVTQGTVYWGPTDGGTNVGAWSHSIAFGPQPVGLTTLSTNIAGLSPDTWYYYRFYASDGTWTEWAHDTAVFATREAPSFYENFEPYANGSQIAGQGNWIYWADNPFDGSNGGAFVTNSPSLSISNSLEVGGIGGIGSGINSDVTWQFNSVTSGVWTLRAMVYIPSNSVVGTHNILSMAMHPNTPDWIGADAAFDLGAGTVNGGQTQFATEQWKEVRIEYRVDSLEFDVYYDGQPLRQNATWDGPNQVEAIDLWVANGAGAGAAPIYFDDLSMERMYISNADGATDLAATSTTLNGELMSVKGTTEVWVYWGLTDGGKDAYAWENATFLGAQSVGSLSTNITGLVAGTAYYYRFFASSARGDDWAHETATFETLSTPTVENTGPGFEDYGTAALRGYFANQNRGDITVYWGLTDGGTDPNAWDHAAPIGWQADATFEAMVTGLLSPYTYYYTCYATNAYGDDWADAATSFATPGPGPIYAGGALNYAYYNDAANTMLAAIDDGVANGQNGGLFALTPTPEAQWPAAVQGKSLWTTEVWQGGNMDDTYCQMWWGYFIPPSSGIYTFVVHGDDYETLWIDLNRDNEFQAAPDLVTTNVPPDGWNIPKTNSVALEGGLGYAIAFAHNEGGGGDWFNTTITAPGGAAVRVIPGDPAQAGWWNYEMRKFTSVDIVNALPSDVTTSAATLNGTLTSTGAVHDVWVYWGPTDQTTNDTLWENKAFVGTYTNAPTLNVSHPIVGLGTGTTTYYAFRASNVLYNVWAAPAASFATVDAPPVVNNIAATTDIGSATLRGELTAGNAADISIFWGRSDGGSSKIAWDGVALLDDRPEGIFSTPVEAGYGVTYYFRCYATNVAGDAWAGSTASFVTVNPGLRIDERVVAYWDFNSKNGSTIPDRAAGAHDGTLIAGADITSGDQGYGGSGEALNLTVEGDYLDAASPTTFDFNSSFTWHARIKTTDGSGAIFSRNPDATAWNQGSKALFVRGNTVQWDTGWISNPQTGTAVQNGTWRQVIATFDEATDNLRMIIDGSTDYNATHNVNNWDEHAHNHNGGIAHTSFTIGKADFSGGLASLDTLIGLFDDVAVFDTNLTGDDLRQLIDLGPSSFVPPGVSITNNTVSGVTADSATLNGALSATGFVFDVSVYWGAADGQTVAANWDTSAFLGSFTNFTGALSYEISGLTADTDYYYTFRAVNQLTDFWATPSEHFTTLGMPVVNNRAATDVTQTSAILNGNLVRGGVGEATIYWGLTDGGTTPGGWQNATVVGTTFGQFGTTVPVVAGGTYYYRCYVTNPTGDDWADPAETFTAELPSVSLHLAINMPPGPSPLDIAGCVLWLAGDDIDGDGDTGNNPADGDPIHVWSDKSGLGHDATRVGQVDPSYNTNGPNGRPVVAFDADRDYMATTYNFDPHTEYSVLSVARYTGGDNERVISSATRNWLFGFHGNGRNEFHASGWVYNGTDVDTNWHLHAGHINNDVDPKASFWTDGVLRIADGTGSGGGNHMIGRLGLGGYRDNNEESNCEIAEILIFNRVLTEEELQQVGFYLDSKYGLNTAYAPVTEARGTFTATAALSAPAISNVTVNFAFAGSFPPGPLTHKGYHKTWVNEDLDLNNNGGLMAMTPFGTATLTVGPSDRGLDFNNDADFINTGAVTAGDYYMNLFLGYFIPRETGTFGFRRNQDDDRCGIWLDLDRDGVFESTTPGLGSNRGEQLQWDGDGGNKQVTLAGGLGYMIAFTHAEGAGGSGVDMRFTTPSATEAVVEPYDPAQYGMWSSSTNMATYASDYTCPTSVVIPAGSLSADVTVTPLGYFNQEEAEGARISIDSVTNGTIGSPGSVSFFIGKDDPKWIKPGTVLILR